jgi:hypothetical protein
VPPAVPRSSRKSPAAKNARYGAIGCLLRQCHDVQYPAHVATDEPPVGDRLPARARDAHVEVEGRLVAGVVVGGEPPRGDVRLPHRDHLAGGAHPRRSPPYDVGRGGRGSPPAPGSGGPRRSRAAGTTRTSCRSGRVNRAGTPSTSTRSVAAPGRAGSWRGPASRSRSGRCVRSSRPDRSAIRTCTS